MAPILAYADFTGSFKLHTNTCGPGLGAALYQTCNDGTNTIISYASRSLSKVEVHYQAHKLEFFTLKWAAVEKFHEYLYLETLKSILITANHIHFNDGKVGCCMSPMGAQPYQLQLLATL